MTKYVEEKKVNAEVEVQESFKKYIAVFETMKDEYFKARAEDIQDVGTRILNNLSGTTYDSLAKLRNKVIAVSKGLTTSDTAQMSKERSMLIVSANEILLLAHHISSVD